MSDATRELWWILVAAAVVALVLATAFVFSVIVQQRRFLAAQRQFSARLLLAQEEERAWIARELHDDLIQRVGLLGHEVAETAALGNGGTTGSRLTGLRAELADLAEEIRRLAHRMHPSVLDHFGLPAALEILADEMAQDDQLTVRVLVEGAPKLTRDQALCFYRVAQEGLRNVVKHAAATEAAVRLRATHDGTTLEVVDGGLGYDISARKARPGLGVTSMQERVTLFGGTLSVVTAPGHGTRLTAWLPHAHPNGEG